MLQQYCISRLQTASSSPLRFIFYRQKREGEQGGEQCLHGRRFTGRSQKGPTMPQVLSPVQYICSQKTLGSNMGSQTCTLSRAPPNLGTPLFTVLMNVSVLTEISTMCLGRYWILFVVGLVLIPVSKRRRRAARKSRVLLCSEVPLKRSTCCALEELQQDEFLYR